LTFNKGTPQELLQRVIKEGVVYFDDVQVLTKDGKSIFTDIYLTDKTNLLQCNILDITLKKELVFERDQMFTAVVQANANCFDSIPICVFYNSVKYVIGH